MTRLGIVCCLAALSASGCVQSEGRKFLSRVKGTMAPDFELAALDGGTVRLSHLRGKPVVLAFWAHG